jgi:hypothetical protein
LARRKENIFNHRGHEEHRVKGAERGKLARRKENIFNHRGTQIEEYAGVNIWELRTPMREQLAIRPETY